ncbi:peptidoglycan-binding protein [Neobittarella massiliensis]|uniref:Autolytic lysozyme n=1 Tax=uncultured Anaerotruncus sp. TaxID=905011 RepID=A0A1C6KBH4_9FIRM|nr:peptidoglycan-binding protein [Neobittarella massiliensis]SCJ91682.1 Autolytic lysozyme [uncultured Anaerotruncus sp.]
MGTGQLIFSIKTAQNALPVQSVRVTVTREENGEIVFDRELVTDADGNTQPISLTAPDMALSLDESYRGAAYETYDVVIEADRYLPFTIKNLQIFDQRTALQEVQMIPDDTGSHAAPAQYYNIPPNQQALPCPCYSTAPPESRILVQPIIPTNITVHLGRPTNASAENVTVSFRDYIKNVASSEIYPTWPENALRANIYCQISLALNRVYTEWYPSRGYNFQITNSTQYDQYFVKNRNIFENISRIVDEIFNVFIRKTGREEPFYAEYCDGRQVTNCPGLKQWGTVTLANQGLTPLQILRRYYGNEVYLYESDRIQDIQQSYPGTPLRLGSSGYDVTVIQNQLNRIRRNYPSIPVINPVDGQFGSGTEAAVRAFQKAFNMTQDGIVGKGTWYKISYIYVAVKKLAELGSEGEDIDVPDSPPSSVLREGDTGDGVKVVQYVLKSVAQFYDEIPDLAVDGIFGPGTTTSVKAFQQYFGLPTDGIVGQETWNKLIQVYKEVSPEVPDVNCPCKTYPGTPLRLGSRGTNVSDVQFYLNAIGTVNILIPRLTVDGIFGTGTQEAVMVFQRLFGLTQDGIVGPATWASICEQFCGLPVKPPCPAYPGGTYRQGSTGNAVRNIQSMLNIISLGYPQIPRVTVDGIFGPATTQSVRLFQQNFGLTVDGIVGQATWNSMCRVYNTI